MSATRRDAAAVRRPIGVRLAAALVAGCVACVACLAVAGCDSLPGKPTEADRPVAPADVKDFAVLYAANCSGCHGADGTLGPATPLNDPVYLVVASDDAIRKATADGVPRTAMPAFATSAGGNLTDEQIGILVREMRARWSQTSKLGGAAPPSYAATSAGDAGRGAAAFATFCASCHGPGGTGGPHGGSVVDPSYLALVSDQALRTAVIAGRPDLGMPDWRGYVSGRAMSPQEVSDVVAWLGAQRQPFPGGGTGRTGEEKRDG